MPTKTKPTRPRRSTVARPAISRNYQSLMLECARIDPATDSVRATQFIAAVNTALAVSWNTMLRLEDCLLPAHTAALLEPIAKTAQELAELLHPLRLPVDLRHAGTAINDEAYFSVAAINAAAELMIAQLRKQESRGLHRRISAAALKGALGYMGRVFDAFADDPLPDDRREFLKICGHYLPKVK